MGLKEIIKYVRQPVVYMFLFGIILTFLLALVFLLGAAYSCNAGNGTLHGLTCSGIEIIKVCEFEGKNYRIPPDLQDELLINYSDIKYV